MNAFAQYKSLTATILRNGLNISSKVKKRNNEFKKKSSKVTGALLIGLGVLSLGFFAVSTSLSLTLTAINSGLHVELVYAFIAMAQLVVMFFGSIAVMSNLYFSKDNQLLATMPFRNGVVFAAKFTVAYLSELAFSAILLLPLLTTAGVVMLVSGLAVPWYYFLIEIIAIFIVPIPPLLIVTLVSLPLMYIVAALKRRALGNGIAMALVYIVVMAIYFLLIGTMTSVNPDTGLSQVAVAAFIGIKKGTIFNYPIVSALFGIKPLLNLLWYIGGVLVILAVSVAISLAFYRRAVNVLSEGSQNAVKKKASREQDSSQRSVFRSFFVKEIKTLLNTPTLLVSTVISIFVPVIAIVFFCLTMSGEGMDTFAGSGTNMFLIGMTTYLSYLIVASTNMVASIGFSREGANLLLLKSLPISARTMVKAKLIFACFLTVLSTLTVSITFPIMSKIHNPISVIGLPIIMLLGGFGSNCMLLYNDLKNPNISWININEITKNNKRMVKPMLVSMAVGFFYIIFGSVIGAVPIGLSESGILAIYYGAGIIPPLVIAIIGYHKLAEDPEGMLAKVGG